MIKGLKKKKKQGFLGQRAAHAQPRSLATRACSVSLRPPSTPYHFFAFRFLLHMDSPARRVLFLAHAALASVRISVSWSPAHACCARGACVRSLVSLSVRMGGHEYSQLMSSEHRLIPPPSRWLFYVTTCLLPLQN